MAERDESSIDFDQGTDINAQSPDDKPKRMSGNASFDETKYLQDQWQKKYKPFFNSLVNQVLQIKREQKAISFANNYSINLHSHNHPIPIPLGAYITSMEWNSTLDDPFQQLRLQLAMPLADASIIFTDDHGKMSPGQYIFFSKKPAFIGRSVADIHKQDYAASQGCFFGYVSDIGWSMSTNSDGQILQSVSLEVSSFIHALQMGQYYISPVDIHDQNVPQPLPDVQTTPRFTPDEIDNLGGSTPFAMKMDDWTRLISIINGVAQGGTPQDMRTVFDPDAETFQSEENQYERTLDKLGLRFDLSGSMYYLMKLLGYPLLPGSLKFEPFDIDTWISLFYTHDMMDTESILIMYKKALSDDQFKRKAQYLANFFRHVGRGATMFTGIDELDRAATFLFEDIEDSVRFEDAIRTGNMNLAPTRLGDTIRIATSKYDLPPSCGLRDTLPEKPLQVNILSSIQSINKVSTTIWSLFEGTFDFDEEMYELFPVLVPIEQGDVVDEHTYGHGIDAIAAQRWDLRGFLHPLHRNMRCIPYIIFRQKPMFPGVSISSVEMSNKGSEFNHNNFVNKPYRDLIYQTYSERTGLNQEGKSYHLVNAFNHDKGTLFHQHEIIALSCQLTDLKRLNGVRIKSPFEGTQRQLSQTVSLADPIIDTYDAQRNGLRMYKGNYPLINVDKEIGENVIGAYAERFFITNGYENNMPAGVVKLRYNGHQKIQPGTWIALNVSGEEMPDGDLRVFPDGRPVDPSAYNQMITRLRNMFCVYATTVSHNHDVDMLGNIISETTIQFERGCWGYQHNLLPYFRAASSDPALYQAPETPDVNIETIGRASPEEVLQKLRSRRPGDASQTGAASGDPGQLVDTLQRDGIDIFESEYDEARRNSIVRQAGAGTLTPIEAQALLENLNAAADEPNYLQELEAAGVLSPGAASLLEYKVELETTATLMLEGGWITQDFFATLQAAIGEMAEDDGNPIPRGLRKAFNKACRSQAVYTTLADDLPIITDSPQASFGWDAEAWVEVDPRFRGGSIR